jgi:hypothetical protein
MRKRQPINNHAAVTWLTQARLCKVIKMQTTHQPAAASRPTVSGQVVVVKLEMESAIGTTRDLGSDILPILLSVRVWLR